MDGLQYVKNAVRTESNNWEEIAQRASTASNIRLLHSAIGISTEAGELLDSLKKHIYYGKEFDKTNFKEEIGDIFWYIAIACDELGVTIESLMERNIEKLQARYPNKFTSEDAINRNLETERKILEK